MYALGAGDLRDEIHAVGSGLGDRRLLDVLFGSDVQGAERAGHRARVPDVAGEAAGVDSGDAGRSVALEEDVEVLGAAPVASPAGQVADDDAAAEGVAALAVVRGHAVVADVGVGERDDLARVRGVGDDLLVAGEDGVEDDLAGGDAASPARPRWPRLRRWSRRPARAARRGRSRFDPGGCAPGWREAPTPHRWASPSITTGSPRRIVWRTPSSVRPAYGVLRLRLARRAGSTVHSRWGRSRTGWRDGPRRSGRRARRRGRRWRPAATTAGRAAPASGRSSSVSARASAVSSPSMPGGAWSNACSLASSGVRCVVGGDGVDLAGGERRPAPPRRRRPSAAAGSP